MLIWLRSYRKACCWVLSPRFPFLQSVQGQRRLCTVDHEFEELQQSLSKFRQSFGTVHARSRRRPQDNQRWRPLSLPLADHPVEVEQLVSVVRRKGASDDLEKALDELEISISASHVCQTLKAVDDVDAAMHFFVWAGQQPNFSHDIDTYGWLVRSLVLAKEFDKIWELLSEMHNAGIQLTDVFFQMIIKAYGEMGSDNEAIHAFRRMADFGVSRTSYCYYAVLDALIKSQKVNLAMELYQEYLKEPSDVQHECVSGMMIGALSEAGWLREACDLAEGMMIRGLPLDVFCWTRLINGYCRVGDVEKGLELFSKMKEAGVEPNVVTHSIIIKGLCKVGKVEDALAHSQQMEREGCPPNVITYASLFDGFCKMGSIDKGYELLKEIRAKGEVFNALIYSIFLTGYSKLQRMDEACQVYTEMLEEGHWPNASTYSTFIQGLCQTTRVKEACKVFNDMKENKCGPNAAAYKVMIQGFSVAGLKDEAEQLFNEMLSKGYEAPPSACNALISCICQDGSLDHALKTFTLMLKQNCAVSWITCNGLLKRLCEEGRVDSAYELLKDIMECGLLPDSCSYNVLINGAAKAGDVDKALMFYSEMQTKGCDTDIYTYGPLCQALCKDRRADGLLDIFRDMRERHVLPNVFVCTVLVAGLCRMEKVADACDVFFKMVEDGFEPTTDKGSKPMDVDNKASESEGSNKLDLKVLVPLFMHLQESGKVAEMVTMWEWVLGKGLFRWIELIDRAHESEEHQRSV